MLDHLVLATPDLDTTLDWFEGGTGVRPVPGGRHLGLGTRNFLVGLGHGGYLEIIGRDPEQPEPIGPRPFGLDALTTARLITWAIRVEKIDECVAAARAAGYDPGPARGMSRETPDGRLLTWQLTLSGDGTSIGVVPFLIDWGTTPHPAADLPVVQLKSLNATHPEPELLRAKLRALNTDLDVRQGDAEALIATVQGLTGQISIA